MEELLDLYDDNKNNTGIIIPRSKEKELPEGKHILISALFAKNTEGKIMIQLTSKEKGNIYSLPSGHVIHGENSKDTIVRELYEEQGIKINKNEIRLVLERLANKISYFDVYYIEKDFKREDMKLQTSEVADVFFLNYDEVKLLHEEGKFRKSSFDIITEIMSKN